MAEEEKPAGVEPLSCDLSRFREQIAALERLAILFVGRECRPCEPFLEALSEAEAEGYLGMDVAVVAVDDPQCDALAEELGVEDLPTVIVYSKGQEVGRVTPTGNYKEDIARLIDLSE
jgi:thioredoxin-like negative regulator of GroEL